MLSVESLSVKIRIDKRFKRLGCRACKALKSLADDGLVTAEDVDMIIGRIKKQLEGMITVKTK